ncbi:hypothetical protein VSH64_03125 [Amycolatopsis rhabdoformis]|uniref:Glycosyltransferase family 2 protein n=1 Tax=Amycolatopsis rhabdoformis TaxID=1448059 RepID=A0ABZ1IC11_9PSEU|nr:hypothetical protein [Amycolatopsis rhabdoformis]WSE31114.1 hypothetical protein VSH64_03125 [Amycolatopsis rhabdoformis]
MTTAVGAPAQHTTHRHLVAEVDAGIRPQAALDAIVVPNGRDEHALSHTWTIARELDAPVLLLCSHAAKADRVVLAAKEAGVQAFAIDTDGLPRHVMPRFATTELLRHHNLLRGADTSLKRNVGLLVAGLARWDRVLFLDDDIALPRPADLREAAGLLGEYVAVGLNNIGMPDNSVVCHAYRESGGFQDTFVGGGALVVGERCLDSFFPDIYNEDWFFLLGDKALRRTALTGSAFQADYDPYNLIRAENEELGDTLAEGVYALLDRGLGVPAATKGYWAEFLEQRRNFIRKALLQVQEAAGLDFARRDRMVEALRTALRQSENVLTPELCAGYLRAWQEDRATWCAHVADLDERHTAGGVDNAFRTLGISELVLRS